jgi:peptidyl-prolyl cis-trans isomerase SurA
MVKYNLALFLSLLVILTACGSSEKSSSSKGVVVGKVANENVYLSELKAQFYKSGARTDENMDSSEELEEIRAFLPLYVDYRAKLVSARDAGYFSDEEILTELHQYETQTAYPFWLENKIKEQLLDELEERSKYELEASHILITLPANPSPSDTLRAYNRLIEAREKALAGENFDSLSVIYSSMQQGRSVGGALGYFSAGWAVKDFEDVAYATNVGDISMPFRTQFGYHIINVQNRRESSQDRLLSHVFIRVPGEADLEEVMERAGEAYEKLTTGRESWVDIVNTYSDDQQSIPMQGSIGWVNYGRYDPRFTDVVMTIPNQGDFTEPFFSGYGVHIVRLDSIRTPISAEIARQELETRLKNLPRYRENREFTTRNVRNAGAEAFNYENLDRFEQNIYDNRGNSFGAIYWTDGVLESNIYRIDNTWYTGKDYLNWIITQIDTNSTNNYHYSLREGFFNDRANKHIVDITKNVFPEFADLSKEYLNGLVIFKISEDSVWNYSKIDTTTLQAMYDENPDKYRFDRRYFYFRIAATADTTLDRAISLVNSGVPVDSLRNEVQGLLIRADVINSLTQEPFNNLDGLNEGEFSDKFDYRNRRTVFLLEKIEEARTMTFEEAFFRVVSEYQPIRENDWITNIRGKYNVAMFPERITTETLNK